jgi:hypothetical protein
VVFEFAPADDYGRFCLQSIRVLSHGQAQG